MRSTGVHHVDLVVSDIERSLRFYRGVLGPLGWHGLHEIPGEHGETINYIHGPGSTIGLRQAPDGAATLRSTATGWACTTSAWRRRRASSCTQSADRIVALGGTISEGPRHYPEYREGYHAVFFFDPDGIKLELSWTPAGTYDWQAPPQ